MAEDSTDVAGTTRNVAGDSMIQPVFLLPSVGLFERLKLFGSRGDPQCVDLFVNVHNNVEDTRLDTRCRKSVGGSS